MLLKFQTRDDFMMQTQISDRPYRQLPQPEESADHNSITYFSQPSSAHPPPMV